MREQFGILGWMARDSSKPGRSTTNGECWVLQSNVREGSRLLGQRDLKGKRLNNIRSVIRSTMVEDFKKSIPLLMSMSNCTSSADQIPKVIESIGHRWGAAFPFHFEKGGEENMFLNMDCHLDLDNQFIACGDYFGKHSGSVESAWLSGRAAANHLLDHLNTVQD